MELTEKIKREGKKLWNSKTRIWNGHCGFNFYANRTCHYATFNVICSLLEEYY